MEITCFNDKHVNDIKIKSKREFHKCFNLRGKKMSGHILWCSMVFYGVHPKGSYATSTVALCCHKYIADLIKYYIVYVRTITLLYKVIQGYMFRL